MNGRHVYKLVLIELNSDNRNAMVFHENAV